MSSGLPFFLHESVGRVTSLTLIPDGVVLTVTHENVGSLEVEVVTRVSVTVTHAPTTDRDVLDTVEVLKYRDKN